MIDVRLREMDRALRSTPYWLRKERLVSELEEFLLTMPGAPSLHTVGEKDFRRFLVFKDRSGRTKIHASDCAFLGRPVLSVSLSASPWYSEVSNRKVSEYFFTIRSRFSLGRKIQYW